jgi:hypothetical protein
MYSCTINLRQMYGKSHEWSSIFTEFWLLLVLPTDVDERRKMAARRRRSELRLHVQIVDHWQQQRGEDVVFVPLRRQFVYVGVREHGWN